ncbi:cytochrome b/b6 domain-containing protein [bacterium]|nr:cytochrome b/b6 domain-containing protein [bacterium]MBU1985461.1 cytochrome b/b6 domain-containing protein [bacterium]
MNPRLISSFFRLVLIASAVCGFALLTFAQSDDDCMMCHSDASLTRTLDNGTIQSLAVTTDSLGSSVHASFSCVDCHADLKGFEDYPHAEKLEAVRCGTCHTDAATAMARGSHEGSLNCAACHGTHNVLQTRNPKSPASTSRINQTCSECHNRLHAPIRGRTAAYANYDVGLHGRHPNANGANGPTCTTCHGTHTVLCEKKLADRLEQKCIGCHGEVAAEFKTSVHADINEGRANSHCYECHGEHRSRAPSDTTLRVLNESPAEATCGSCHAESVARYNQSLHAYALAEGSPRAPRCESCHGAHSIRRVSDPHSPIARGNQVRTCAACHSQIGITLDPDIRMPRSFENYEESSHGRLLGEGNTEVPVCVDCHGGHAIRASSDPTSTINPKKIDEMCGRCHAEEQRLFRESIHYRALMFGIDDSPTCTGCHGEHIQLSPNDPNSRVSRSRQSHETCGRCHNNPMMIRKYGLAPDVVTTYEDSYHGLATRGRSARAAVCADCHQAHAVRTARDTLSTIHERNVTETCRQCHPRADTRFAQSYTHTALQPRTGGINYWIAQVYWVLILVIVGGMLVHNLIILNWHILETRRRQDVGRRIVRFDIHQLIQHMALTISFITLAVTGFALKYPDAWWVRWLAALGMDESVRRMLHRVMAVVLIACSVYHVIYLFLTRRGWDEWKAMMPDKRDVVDLADTMKFHLNLNKKVPEYARYDYSQKAEYWALIWGTIAMIITGIILWFPAQLAPLLPGWAITAAQTIHFYEAWLATLAIVVWHFFFVIFHPEEYPMSWTWLTGRMNIEQVKHRHRRWYRALMEQEAARSAEAETPSPKE